MKSEGRGREWNRKERERETVELYKTIIIIYYRLSVVFYMHVHVNTSESMTS